MLNDWFIKICQAKPMALPVYPEEGEYQGEGVNLIDTMMKPQTAHELKSKFPEIRWHGSGSSGVVNKCEPGMVCKYTDSRREANMCRYIMKHPNPYIMKVYDVKLIQKQPYLWMIKSEELRLPTEEQKMLYGIMQDLEPQNLDHMADIKGLKPHIYRARLIFDATKEYGIVQVREMESKCHKLFRGLESTGYELSDNHQENIGFNAAGDLVILDLDLLKKFS